MSGVWNKVFRYKWWLIAGVVLAVAAKAALTLYDGKTPQSVQGQTVAVERGDIAAVVSATGTVKPVNMVDISSKITGLIKSVKVNENDYVKAGQVLLELDDTHLGAQVAQAQARLTNAQSNYARNQSLNEAGAVSDQQLQAAETDYYVAKAAYEDSVSQLDDTVIKAPIDGRVIGKPIPAGQTVAPGVSSPMVLMTIADISKIQVETQIDESDIGQVKIGQPATFTVDAYPGQTFTGVVVNVSDKATVQQNVVYYNVLIDVTAANDLLKPNMTARVSVNVGESKNTLTVPLSAVKSANGQQYVSVSHNGQLQNVPVTTGLISDDKVEITSGLSENDAIIIPQAKPQAQSNRSPQGGLFRGLGR